MPARLMAKAAMALAALAACVSAAGHEFWIESAPWAPAVGEPVVMTLQVGEYLVGERVGVTASHAASLRLFSAGGVQDLGHRVPRDSMLPSLTLTLPQAGTHVLAYESHPSQVVLPAGEFHAYLHDEGLDAIIRQREAKGTAEQDGRERFRRSAKTLLQVGGRADAAYGSRTGQKLEITPLADPLSAVPGERLAFALRFEGKPLGGVLVKAWHRGEGQTTVLRARADPQGGVAFVFPFAGPWMLNVVHMVAATDSPDVDWDSFWGSLTFSLAPGPGIQPPRLSSASSFSSSGKP